MSMTESEAIERIKEEICHGNPKGLCRDACMYGKGKCAYDMATRALEEIQQYRAIGTVSEFRELKEKATAKRKCPNCNELLSDEYRFCPTCRRKIDWSEGKE